MSIENPSSLRNERTQALSLYVMQNEHGAFKVGRSATPEARVMQVAQAFGCKVRLVTVFPKQGHREEWCHLQLAEHAYGSEWFEGTTEARAAVARLLGAELTWPYEHNEETLPVWLKSLAKLQGSQYWRGRERKVFRILLGLLEGSTRYAPFIDGDIALLTGYRDLVSGCALLDATGKRVPVPAFTTSLEAAKLLWPEDLPRSDEPTTDEPIDYCLEALAVRWCYDISRLASLT